jgi:hypothetical protein
MNEMFYLFFQEQFLIVHFSLKLLGLSFPLSNDLTLFVDLFVGIVQLEKKKIRFK